MSLPGPHAVSHAVFCQKYAFFDPDDATMVYSQHDEKIPRRFVGRVRRGPQHGRIAVGCLHVRVTVKLPNVVLEDVQDAPAGESSMPWLSPPFLQTQASDDVGGEMKEALEGAKIFAKTPKDGCRPIIAQFFETHPSYTSLMSLCYNVLATQAHIYSHALSTMSEQCMPFWAGGF